MPLPRELFDAIWRIPIDAAFAAAGLPADVRARWLNSVSSWLVADGVLDEKTGIARTGKQFDDSIDSVLSLAAAVGIVLGQAHIHQGEDPADGYIIGPGIKHEEPGHHSNVASETEQSSEA